MGTLRVSIREFGEKPATYLLETDENSSDHASRLYGGLSHPGASQAY
jgi:hypothetical protein